MAGLIYYERMEEENIIRQIELVPIRIAHYIPAQDRTVYSVDNEAEAIQLIQSLLEEYEYEFGVESEDVITEFRKMVYVTDSGVSYIEYNEFRLIRYIK